MTKAALRKEYLQKRLSLSVEAYDHENEKIASNFLSAFDFSKFKIFHTFLPITRTKEVNTWLIINQLSKEHPQIKIVIPRINPETSELEHFFLDDVGQLKENTWGIPEPTYGVPASITEIDLVIVPLLAADEAGHRVGYGRGFYDNMLKHCKPNTVKVGVSFFPPVKEIEDLNKNDQPINILVTPDKVINYKN